jgi:hypothetical protein
MKSFGTAIAVVICSLSSGCSTSTPESHLPRINEVSNESVCRSVSDFFNPVEKSRAEQKQELVQVLHESENARNATFKTEARALAVEVTTYVGDTPPSVNQMRQTCVALGLIPAEVPQ